MNTLLESQSPLSLESRLSELQAANHRLAGRQRLMIVAAVTPFFILSLSAAGLRELSNSNGLLERVRNLERREPPVGAIIAYAGEWPPARPDGVKLTEEEIGWTLCDGRSLQVASHRKLFAAIGNVYGGDKEVFNLPQLCGKFLRGVDHGTGNDPDAAKRASKARQGDTVGSEQGWATAVSRITIDKAGQHSHVTEDGFGGVMRNCPPGQNNTVKRDTDCTTSEPDIFNIRAMPMAGEHAHALLGGDQETRPLNVAVFCIIKI